jgi:hypothetical protein
VERLHAAVDSQSGLDETRAVVNFTPRDTPVAAVALILAGLASPPGRAVHFRKLRLLMKRRGWASRVGFVSSCPDCGSESVFLANWRVS